MTTKHTTVILPNKEIQDLTDQVTKLTAERDLYQKEAIEAKIKVEKMKLLMEGIKIERPNTNVIL
jgi:hypothetical protein